MVFMIIEHNTMLEALTSFIKVLSRLEKESIALHQYHQKNFDAFLVEQGVTSLNMLINKYPSSKELEIYGSRIKLYKLFIDSSSIIFSDAISRLKADFMRINQAMAPYLKKSHLDEIRAKIIHKLSFMTSINHLKDFKRKLEIDIKYSTEKIEKFNKILELVNLNERIKDKITQFEYWEKQNLNYPGHKMYLVQYFEIILSFEERKKWLNNEENIFNECKACLGNLVPHTKLLVTEEIWDDVEFISGFETLNLADDNAAEVEYEDDPFANIDDFTPGYDASLSTQASSSSANQPSTSSTSSADAIRKNRERSNSF